MAKDDIVKHQFKKGESGNPKGRPKNLVSSVLAELKEKGHEKVNKSAVSDVYEYLIGLGQSELTKLGGDATKPMLFRIVAKNILSKKGFEIIEKMLDRAHGKAMQSKELAISGEVKLTNDLSILSDEDLDELERITTKLEAGKSGKG